MVVIAGIDKRYLYMYDPKRDYMRETRCFLGKGVYGNIEKVCSTAFEYLGVSPDRFSIVTREYNFPRQGKRSYDEQYSVQYVCVENKYKKYWDLYHKYFTYEHEVTPVPSDSEDEYLDYEQYVGFRASLIDEDDGIGDSDDEDVYCSDYEYEKVERHLLKSADQRYLFIFTSDNCCTITNCRIPNNIYGDTDEVHQLAARFLGLDPSSIAIVARKNDLPAKYSSSIDKKHDIMYVIVRHHAVVSWNMYCNRHGYDYKIEPFTPDPTESDLEEDVDGNSESFVRSIDQRYLYMFNANKFECTKTRCLLDNKSYGNVANVLQRASEYFTKDPSSIAIVCRRDIFPRQNKVKFDQKYDTMYICVMKIYIEEWNEYSTENMLNLALCCPEALE